MHGSTNVKNIFFRLSCLRYVGSGICDELITRPEESYRVCVSNLCSKNLKTRRPRLDVDSCATKNIFHDICSFSVVIQDSVLLAISVMC
jgi:hypothetical protein